MNHPNSGHNWKALMIIEIRAVNVCVSTFEFSTSNCCFSIQSNQRFVQVMFLGVLYLINIKNFINSGFHGIPTYQSLFERFYQTNLKILFSMIYLVLHNLHSSSGITTG